MSIALAVDLLVAGLLVATIAYAVVLNRRLGQLRDGGAQMERLINDFYQATTRAESGLMALKEAAGSSDTDVTGQLDSLAKLHDELEFMVARAEAESAKLEHLIREGRGQTTSVSTGATRRQAPDSGLDAELFGGPENMSGGGQPQRPEPVAPTPKSAAFQELR
jgi:hypothetical protein